MTQLLFTVILQELNSDYTPTGSMCGEVKPIVNMTIKLPLWKIQIVQNTPQAMLECRG